MIEGLAKAIESSELTSSLKENLGAKDFNPDKRLNPEKGSNETIRSTSFNPDERIHQDRLPETSNSIDKGYLTTSMERKELAGRSKGEWDGEVGDSKFVPDKEEAKNDLKKYGESSISYKDGIPDFSKVAESTVSIEDMTSIRQYNFMQADKRCAEQWNNEQRGGRSDWTAREIKQWRHDNKCSWHERIDRKTMDLVPSDLHLECKHYGGVSECRRYEALRGEAK